MSKSGTCVAFVLSSFARTYGVPRIMSDGDIRKFAEEWCANHNSSSNLYLDDLRKIDKYFRDLYENNHACY